MQIPIPPGEGQDNYNKILFEGAGLAAKNLKCTQTFS
jgi:hypothetical protein